MILADPCVSKYRKFQLSADIEKNPGRSQIS